MRAEEADILIIPGLGGSGPNHWQSRWQGGLKTARRIEQGNWHRPDRAAWRSTIEAAIAAAARPVILVAHSLGVLSAVDAATGDAGSRIAGAFFVTPPDAEDPHRAPPEITAFAPLPREPLPFPSLFVASRDDPYCAFERSQELAAAWSSALVDAGESGHINPDSGHGPWPDGLLLLSRLLRGISVPGKSFDG